MVSLIVFSEFLHAVIIDIFIQSFPNVRFRNLLYLLQMYKLMSVVEFSDHDPKI